MHEIPSQGSVSIAGLVVFLGNSGANNSANINNGVWYLILGLKLFSYMLIKTDHTVCHIQQLNSI